MSEYRAIDVNCGHPVDGLCLDLVGPLRLRDMLGSDLTPKGMKAQGMLALIGTSPVLRRSRAWLQDKLWSDRAPEQGAASLRQCLVRIRSALGRHVGCLETDRTWVAFDPGRVQVRRDCGPVAARDAEFLEGIDIRDPEFEHWIRDQRMAYADQYDLACEADARAGFAMAGPEHSSSRPPAIGLVTRCASGDGAGGRLLADQIIELVAVALLDHSGVEIVDLRSAPERDSLPRGRGSDWLLCATASIWRARVRIALTLTELGAGRLRWTEARIFDVEAFYSRDSTTVEGFARHIADCVGARILAPPPGSVWRVNRTPPSIPAIHAA